MVEPVDRVDPVDRPADPVDHPADPADRPAGPVGQVGSAGPMSQAGPVGPAHPVGPAEKAAAMPSSEHQEASQVPPLQAAAVPECLTSTP